jgi:orotidine-5'-phosphate decarboxylase
MRADCLIVALDLPSAEQALALAEQVRPHVGLVKVGLEGFVGAGPRLVRQLVDSGLEVFLDLKLHDIPRTAAAAAARAGDLGVRMLTVHAGGGGPMIEAVRRALPASTTLLAVTLLTSFDAATAASVGWVEPVDQITYRLAQLGLDHGADGLVLAASELPVVRALRGLRVVPGVRLAHADRPAAAADDQRRTTTPGAALAAGADYLVVGRPIVQAADPAAAAASLAKLCAAGAAP